MSKITIKAPARKVWEALTQPELVKQWQYGSELITNWQPNSPIRFRNEWEGQVYEQWGTVLEVNKPEFLKYNLFAPRPDLEDKPENYFLMTYALEEKDGHTTLVIAKEDEDESDEEDQDNPVLNTLKTLVENQAGLPA